MTSFTFSKVSSKNNILVSINYRYHEKVNVYHLTPQSLMGDGVPPASVPSLKTGLHRGKAEQALFYVIYVYHLNVTYFYI